MSAGRTRWRARCIGGFVLVGALGVSACGGGGGSDGPKLSRTAFLERANTECATLKHASEALAKAEDPSTTGVAVSTFMRLASDKLRRLVREVDGLVPPDALAGDVDSLLSLLDHYAGGLTTLAGRVEPGATFQQTLEANATLVDRLNGDADHATNLAATIGLVGCILSP